MEAEKVYQDNIRKMTPTEKVRVAMSLYQSVRSLKSAKLSKDFPELTVDQIKRKVDEWMWYSS